MGWCRTNRLLVLITSWSPNACFSCATAQIPAGYYETVDSSNAASLRTTLHDLIDDHTRFPYTSSSTDTWDILESADEDPADPDSILDVYRNRSFDKEGGGNDLYQREHTWPKAYGFPNDDSTNYPYTDCHHLFLSDAGYNSSRSNKPYAGCNAECTEKVTDENNGEGGGEGTYPGNSNWTKGSFTQGIWETWIGRRGDVARALYYMDVRYEGGSHGESGADEPDLILTNDRELIASNNRDNNESISYMGILATLLQWHTDDPVDEVERNRNDVVFTFQNNRNPFIDHPQWVDCLFNGNCQCSVTGDCDTLTESSGAFANCIMGPGRDVSGACFCPDVDDDNDVDIIDFALFQAAIMCSP